MPLNQSLEATAAAHFVSYGSGKFTSPWLRHRQVSGGCASVPRWANAIAELGSLGGTRTYFFDDAQPIISQAKGYL